MGSLLWRRWRSRRSLLCLTGCANLGYYWQSATGHMRMLQAARPVQEWLARRAGAAAPEGASWH